MKIVYTFFIKLPLFALVAHTSRLRSLAAPARARAPGSACASQSRPRISAEASRRDRRCESAPFPLASRFPFRMMRATEDRRRIWEPHRQGTRRSSSRRPWSFTESPGRPTRRWRAGWAATPGPVRLGQEGRRGRLRDGRQPVPDGRGPARAQARERAAEEEERDTFKSERPLRRQAAVGESAKRAKFEFIFPSEGRWPVSEMCAALGATRRGHCARKGRPPSAHAMRDGGARRIDHPGQKRGARHMRRARCVLRAEAHGRARVDEARGVTRACAKRPSGGKRAARRGARSKTRSSAGSRPAAPTWRSSPTSLA